MASIHSMQTLLVSKSSTEQSDIKDHFYENVEQDFSIQTRPTSETQQFYIRNQIYNNDGRIGEGAFGQVFKVTEKSSGRIFALKQVDFSYEDY